jgi:DNA-binding beta-propeller fold protein YncE
MTIPNAILLSLLMVAPGIGLAAQPTAYVINTSSQTLSKIDLTGSVVSNDILPLGSDIYSFPNQLVIRDTLAYVVASGTDEIQIIDLNAERTVGWIRFPDYSNPYWMAFLDDQFLYVTLMTDNSLAKVDITSQQVVRTTPIGLSPEGIFICRG